MRTTPPVLVWVVALACCYHAAPETPCAVSCATDVTCPTGLACGADQLCHGGDQDCSALVVGSFGHEFVTNNGSGLPFETDVADDADQLDVSVILDDIDTMPAISFGSDNSFSFSRDSAADGYRLSVRPQQETAIPTETQDVGASLELWTPYFGRFSRAAVNKPTTISFQLTNAASTAERAYASSTGVRTLTNIATGSAQLDWETATPLFGANTLLDAADGDVLWYTSFAAAGSAYFSIVGDFRDAVTLSNGSPLTVTGAVEATTADHCVVLGLPRETETTRVSAANGFGAGSGVTLSSTWGLQATPFAALSPGAGIAIVTPYAVVPISDQQITIDYANPYPEDQVAFMNAVFRRVATIGSSSIALNYVTTQYAQVATAPPTACAAVSLNATIAMPGIATFGGTRLDTDGATVTLDRSGLVELDFTPTAPGDASDWVTVLFEMTPAGTTFTSTELRVYSTLSPTVMIDPTLLQQGNVYMFEIYSRLGFPNAATRDYRTISYPYGTGVAYSSLFIVGN